MPGLTSEEEPPELSVSYFSPGPVQCPTTEMRLCHQSEPLSLSDEQSPCQRTVDVELQQDRNLGRLRCWGWGGCLLSQVTQPAFTGLCWGRHERVQAKHLTRHWHCPFAKSRLLVVFVMLDGQRGGCKGKQKLACAGSSTAGSELGTDAQSARGEFKTFSIEE